MCGGGGGGGYSDWKSELRMVFILQYKVPSLLQEKHRQTSIMKCFRCNLYITGSHFGERFTKIVKMGGGGGGGS